MTAATLDLHTVDRRVARAYDAACRAHASLGTSEGRVSARGRDPLEGLRDVAGRTTFNALRDMEASPIQGDHRDGLVRWVHELLQERVAWELVVDEADAIHEPDPNVSARVHRGSEARSDDASLPLLLSFDEARRAVIGASTARAAELAFARLAELAAPVAAVRREHRSRRFEAARRLGLEHPWALATPKGIRELETVARRVFDRTEPLARELHKDHRRRVGSDAVGPWQTIHDSFAFDAREGWPARLSARWLEDVFRALAPRPPRIASLPPAIGGASFVRAATEWGSALRLQSVARSLPFALARDPYPVEARLFGCALAVAVASRAFAKRKLDLPARTADAHARALGKTLLTALRAAAAEVIAGMSPTPADDVLEELTARLYGAPLPAHLAAAWAFGGFSGRARTAAPARLVAAARAHGFLRNLVERFDEDWFDNPRAGAHLASVGAGPVWSAELPDDDAVHAMARALEEDLG